MTPKSTPTRSGPSRVLSCRADSVAEAMSPTGDTANVLSPRERPAELCPATKGRCGGRYNRLVVALLTLLVGPLAVTACDGGSMTRFGDGGGGDAVIADLAPDQPSGPCPNCSTDDCDLDGLLNVEETQLGTDPCQADSDGDGIPDKIEVEAPKICVGDPESETPRPIEGCEKDSDCSKGKCVGYDPTDADQDKDGVKDGEEDRDKNGLIGDCAALCPQGDECGDGQTCQAGTCTPLIDVRCIGTETDPRLADTDGDGRADKDEGSNIVCNTAALITPTLDTEKGGDWTLALNPAFGATRRVTIANGQPTEAAITFDDSAAVIAGFVLAKAGTSDPIKQDEADEQAMAGIANLTIAAVFNRQPFTTYDSFPAVVSQRLVTAASARSPGDLRDALLTALSGHTAAELTIPAGPSYATGTTVFSLLITTVVRSDRVIIVGAVAPQTAFDNTSNATAIRMRDLTNGTALGRSGKGLKAECDGFVVEALPIADIVWLIDASGSMNDDQQLISDTAKAFFTKLQSSSLDFRVGVMRGGCSTSGVGLTGGKFTTNQATFSAQVKSPTGPGGCETETPITAGKNLHERVLMKNPPVTQPGDMSMGLRPGAKLIYVLVTDEEERNLQSSDTASRTLTQAAVEAHKDFPPLLAYYQQHQISAFGMIALVPDCTKKYEPSWAAKAMTEKTGGASWPICRTDKAVLTAALNALITAAQGAASTFKLSRVPISSTLKLAVEGNEVPRSRADGFDYDGPNNAIIFNLVAGSPWTPKVGDSVFVSYRFFEDAPSIN